MPPIVSLAVYFLFVFWLFRNDGKMRGAFAPALWVPLIWVLTILSKSPASWIAAINHQREDSNGNLLDTLFFLSLLIAGIRILSRRPAGWQAIFASNRWIIAFFCFTGLSVAWSDYQFFAIKQWIKDCGNIVMVLVILSEPDPAGAAKGILLRAGYILIPLSLILVKYFPELGRQYDTWTYKPKFIGVSTNKNILGASLLVCVLGLIWSLYDLWKRKPASKYDLALHAFVGLMAAWLLSAAHSATALACALLGTGMLFVLGIPAIRAQVQRMGLSLFILLPVFVITLHMIVNLGEAMVVTLGRDLTFTGRTSIWEWCLKADINPIMGTGYCNFWKGERATTISQGIGFYYILQEAHNGYLETYLNCGLIGFGLLLGSIASGIRRICRTLITGSSFAAFRFTALVLAMIYNMSESAFNGLNAIWFLLLLAIVEYPPIPQVAVEPVAEVPLENASDAPAASMAGAPGQTATACQNAE